MRSCQWIAAVLIASPLSADPNGLFINIGTPEERAAQTEADARVGLPRGAVGTNAASEVLSDPDRAAAEKERYAKKGRYAMEDGGYEEAAMHFTSALAIFPKVMTAPMAMNLARSNEWEPADRRRVEAAGLYANRSYAYLRAGDWKKYGARALQDGLAASMLAPVSPWAIAPLAGTVESLVALEPGCASNVVPPWAATSGASDPAKLLPQFCHALVAEAYLMLTEVLQFVPGKGFDASLDTKEIKAARRKVGGHLKEAGGMHPKNPSDLADAVRRSLIAGAVKHALTSKAYDGDNDAFTVVQQTQLATQSVITLGSFRLGNVAMMPQEWRPPNEIVPGLRASERLVEAWYKQLLDADSDAAKKESKRKSKTKGKKKSKKAAPKDEV
tara:strand:+ start:215 stop:1372 length:1158 start_codon:yes stop_codon:yes gene_type:complete